MNMRKPAIFSYMRNDSGSALVSTFLILLVILVLGAGVLTFSAANARQAVADNTFERAYYAAEGGARQGVEALKSAALDQYTAIARDMQNGTESGNNAASFFSVIDAIASYGASDPDNAAGAALAVDVGITHTVSGTDSDTHVYSVLSTAAGGAVTRSVLGRIAIKFVPVTKQTAAFTPLGSETILAGSTFRQNSGWSAVSGTVKFGAFSSYNPGQFRLNDMDKSDTSSWIVPSVKDSINWSMKYPGFTDAVRTPALSLPPIANGTEVTNAAFQYAPYYWTVPSPIYLEGQPGASFTISRFRYEGGQVYCTGNLGFSNDFLGTPSSYAYVYCKGNLSFSSGAIQYARIYCGGNLTINGGGGLDHVTIYCNGSISDSCTDRKNVRVYCKSYTMNGGNFRGDNVVYAENSIHLESTVSGLFYTNGNIDLGSGSGLTGQMVAKGNITLNGSFNFKPDQAMLDRLNVDPFMTSSPSDSTVKIIQPPSAEIFTGDPTFSES